MNDSGKKSPPHKAASKVKRQPMADDVHKPDWATGLKQFYDSVVDEPLPDELADLLARFDDGAGE